MSEPLRINGEVVGVQLPGMARTEPLTMEILSQLVRAARAGAGLDVRTRFWSAGTEAVLSRLWGRPHTNIETVSGRAIFDKAKASSTQELTITAQALRLAIPAIEIEAETRVIAALRAASPTSEEK